MAIHIDEQGFYGRFGGAYVTTVIKGDVGSVRAAVDAVLAGQPAPEDQKPSMGCNIKWTAGNEPSYYGS
ncbi:MAG: BMC domain-containing protein [Lewinella sp.]|nr:BMC domain-containing protein [Lewinella sp.]